MLDKIKVINIMGTRPEIIKMSPIIRAMENDAQIEQIIVHSGQHYDYELAEIFYEELNLPKPDIVFKTGSGTHATQTAYMLEKFEQIFLEKQPDIVLVEGDTNTVLAAGLAAIKLKIPLGHVEAGLRSYDRRMPEEINRQLTQVCAEYHFSPTSKAALNLLFEGVPPDKIFITGNTIVDACYQNIDIAIEKSKILKSLNVLQSDKVILVTFHRPDNTDIKTNLTQIVDILTHLNKYKVIFPLHPRTKKKLVQYDLLKKLEYEKNIILTEPLGYLDFIKLLDRSNLVITDSGGIQEEAITLKTPCLTLRYNTERPETVELGFNHLVGRDKKLCLDYVEKMMDQDYLKKYSYNKNPYGDGNAGNAAGTRRFPPPGSVRR